MMFQRVDAITEKVLFLHNSVIGESQGMPLLMYLMGWDNVIREGQPHIQYMAMGVGECEEDTQ